MTLILAQKHRGLTRNIQILDAAGNVITPGANDLVRIRIGREGQADVLSVTSGTPTANGSSVTKGQTSVVNIMPNDLDFTPGAYTLYVEYWDNAAASWKEVSRECFVLEHID